MLIKFLWFVAHHGHVDVARWIMAQTPSLITLERLMRMQNAILPQKPTKRDPKGDLQQVLSWIEASIWEISHCE